MQGHNYAVDVQHRTNNIAIRGCNQYGFFAEFLWVLNHLEWCLRNNKVPVVYWDSTSAYYSPAGFNGASNVWEYYFEPVSSESYKPGSQSYRQETYNREFTTIWWYAQYIDNMSLLPTEKLSCIHVPNHSYNSSFNYQRSGLYPIPFGSQHLYATTFRKYVKETLIDPFIKIKPIINNKIETFWQTHMQGKKTVGIHLRGQHMSSEVIRVPDEIILAEANKYAALGYQFLVATDQTPLAEKAKQTLQGPVILYDCYRAMVPTAPSEPHQLTPQQGEDMLVEALLLSRCDHFIHTLSQVSTAVLYFNPDLPHTLLY